MAGYRGSVIGSNIRLPPRERAASRWRLQTHDPHDPQRGVRGDNGGPRRRHHLRHHGQRLHGRHGHLRAGRHRVGAGGPRAGSGPYGRRVLPGVGSPRSGHRPERPGHLQLRDRNRGGLLGPQPGGDRHPRGRDHGHRPRRLPGGQPAADVRGVHQVPGPCEQRAPHGRADGPLLRPGPVGDGPHPAQHPPRPLLRRHRRRDPPAPAARPRPRRGSDPQPGRRTAGRRGIPGDDRRRRRGDGRRPGRDGGPGRAPRLPGGQQLPPQRLVPRLAPAVVRPPGLPGLQSSHEAHLESRRGAGPRHPAGPVRHPAPARARLLARRRQGHPGGRRLEDAGSGQAHRRGHLRGRRSGRGRADRPSGRPGPGLRRHSRTAGRGDRPREGRMGGRARRLDRGDRRLQRGHDQAGRGRGRRLDAPPPGAARAREGDAGAGDGVHRHRQHQLGGQQLPALRGAPVVLRRHELGQLRLRAAHHHRGEEGRSRPSRGGLRRRRGLGYEHGGDHDRGAP